VKCGTKKWNMNPELKWCGACENEYRRDMEKMSPAELEKKWGLYT
jgi:hypothetical protein